jgi:hypothetical protein
MEELGGHRSLNRGDCPACWLVRALWSRNPQYAYTLNDPLAASDTGIERDNG